MDLEQQNALLEQQLAAEVEKNQDLKRQLQEALNAVPSGGGGLNARIKEKEQSQLALEDLHAQLQQLSSEKQRLAEEKTSLENALEAEQEYIMHKLHKQLLQLQGDKRSLMHEKQNLAKTVNDLAASVSRLSREKVDLEQAMEMEEEAFVNKLMRQLLQVMNSYKQMEKVLADHGLTITRSDRRRSSRNSDADARRSGSLPRGSMRRASSHSLGGSPAPSAHARPSLDPMHVTRSFDEQSVPSGSARGAKATKQVAQRQQQVMREDSSSSLGSAMSIVSRDVSVSRDCASLGASGHLHAMHIGGFPPERGTHR